MCLGELRAPPVHRRSEIWERLLLALLADEELDLKGQEARTTSREGNQDRKWLGDALPLCSKSIRVQAIRHNDSSANVAIVRLPYMQGTIEHE